MYDYNNNGISDKEDLIIMETDEENMRNGANTAIPAIVVGIIVIAVTLYFTVLWTEEIWQIQKNPAL